jgi:cobalt-zinc-cadmium efflux system membrane fusion protein
MKTRSRFVAVIALLIGSAAGAFATHAWWGTGPRIDGPASNRQVHRHGRNEDEGAREAAHGHEVAHSHDDEPVHGDDQARGHAHDVESAHDEGHVHEHISAGEPDHVDEHAPDAGPSHDDEHAPGAGHAHDVAPAAGLAGAGVRVITKQTARTIGLETHKVGFGPMEEVVELLGAVGPVPDRRHVITTRTRGQVLHLHVQAGDTVKKGDVLIEVDSPELARNIFEARRLEADYQKLLVEVTRAQGRVRELEVELKTAQEAAVLAEAEVARLEAAAHIVPLNELNDTRAEALRARALVDQKTVQLEVARQEAGALAKQSDALRLTRDAIWAVSNVDATQADILTGEGGTDACEVAPRTLGLMRLRAPIDGLVVERRVSPGQGVEPGDPLLVVADYHSVQVHGELPESLIPRVTAARQPEVRIRPQANPQNIIKGRVRFVSPVIDPVKRTAHLIVDAPNPDGVMQDGAFVTLAVVVREMNIQSEWPVVVPESAIVKDGPEYFVFRQDHPGELIFHRQDITPGLRNDLMVEVRGGLAPGDVIVSKGAYSLSQVRPPSAALADDPHAGHAH